MSERVPKDKAFSLINHGYGAALTDYVLYPEDVEEIQRTASDMQKAPVYGRVLFFRMDTSEMNRNDYAFEKLEASAILAEKTLGFMVYPIYRAEDFEGGPHF